MVARFGACREHFQADPLRCPTCLFPEMLGTHGPNLHRHDCSDLSMLWDEFESGAIIHGMRIPFFITGTHSVSGSATACMFEATTSLL